MYKPCLRLCLALCLFISFSCQKNNNKSELPHVFKDKSIVNGYLDKQSYFPGDTALLYVSTDYEYKDSAINVYDANGALSFKIPYTRLTPQDPQGEKPYEDGFHYSNPVTIKVPEVKSGVYLIAKQIPIIIKTREESVDLTIVYPFNTENAYCQTGRRSLYTTPVASKVSFLRPIPYTILAAGFFKWIVQQHYSYNVISDIDLEDYRSIKGKVLMIVGHSEYWSRTGRRNFDRFVNEGKHAIVLSGNTMWWQVRYNDDKNQLICYKGVDEPPLPDTMKTILWIFKALRYPITASIGCDFDRGGYGIYGAGKNESWGGFKVATPQSPLLAGLNLKKGDIIECPSNEYDGAPLSGFESDGTPIIDNKELRFNKIELIGYDKAFRTVKTVATAMVFRRTATSGIIVECPSTDWCTERLFSTNAISRITRNAIDGLLADKNMFSH